MNFIYIFVICLGFNFGFESWSQELNENLPSGVQLLPKSSGDSHSKPETLKYENDKHSNRGEAFANPLDPRNNPKGPFLTPEEKLGKILKDLDACTPSIMHKKLNDEINSYVNAYPYEKAGLPQFKKLESDRVNKMAQDDLLKFRNSLNQELQKRSEDTKNLQNQDYYLKFKNLVQTK